MGYFEADAAVNALTAAKLEELLGYFRPLALTKAEKLQLVNMLPKTEVEFYLVSSRLQLVGSYARPAVVVV